MHIHFYSVAWYTMIGIVLGTGVLHLIPVLGAWGKQASASLCRAPGLDWVITYFTVLPLFVGPIVDGWGGFFGAIIGQVGGLIVWTLLHELTHPGAWHGPRIVKFDNQLVGAWRNFAAVYITAIVTPIFWMIRMVQIFLWPSLTYLIGLPAYPGGEWVNVSRHKFSGLVGHDLIWCLYCDWMTGVWSLGSEMLRNVESFWCPIRFHSDKKCANCAVDFPDVNGGWVSENGSMADVVGVLEKKYADGNRGWFGHPARLTVKGSDVEPTIPPSGT